jgi:hypothetical protein
MRSWGISRPSRHLKRRLTAQTGEISPVLPEYSIE